MADRNSNNPTWEPRVILKSGEVVRLPGGLSHASAIAAAEAAAKKFVNVEYVSARRERYEVTASSDKERQEAMKRRSARDTMTVRSWFVCCDKKEADGSTVFSSRLSPDFNTEEKARQAFEKVDNPSKYVCYMDRFFSPTRPGDIELRAEYLASLH